MRKLESFKKDETNVLSANEMLSISGSLTTSRTSCFTDTASEGCCDTRLEKTIDNNDGTVVTTITEVDKEC